MKSFDSRTYSINDFVEWDNQKQLVLNPAFQRRPVWSEKAKSYLIDTIIRGKPIPKVFIRQKLNVTTKRRFEKLLMGSSDCELYYLLLEMDLRLRGDNIRNLAVRDLAS